MSPALHAANDADKRPPLTVEHVARLHAAYRTTQFEKNGISFVDALVPGPYRIALERIAEHRERAAERAGCR